MKHFVCVEPGSWEAVVRGAARYPVEGEAVVACVVDERAPRGYELAVKGLLGRRERPEEPLASVSEEAARGVLADATALLGRLRPNLAVRTLLLRGVPHEELARAAQEEGADAVFVGRRGAGAEETATVSGVVAGWLRNRHGEPDGLRLEDGTEVRFPPHLGSEVGRVAREGAAVEVRGVWKRRHLHARLVTDTGSGASVELREESRSGARRNPVGHTARFVLDHASCDVVVLWP